MGPNGDDDDVDRNYEENEQASKRSRKLAKEKEKKGFSSFECVRKKALLRHKTTLKMCLFKAYARSNVSAHMSLNKHTHTQTQNTANFIQTIKLYSIFVKRAGRI